jgi:hypothetical protein
MLSDAATAIAYVGAFVGLVGGGVALFNARKAVCWKRAELANTYMKDIGRGRRTKEKGTACAVPREKQVPRAIKLRSE